MSQDQSYYAARAAEERRLASASTDPAVRRAHLTMAFEYARLAGVHLMPVPETTHEPEQRTA